MKTPRIAMFAFLLGLGGCTADVPLDLTGGLPDWVDSLRQNIEGLLEDPLDTRPYPVLVGGDAAALFYSTSLTDVRVNFEGRTNDFVFPSLVGPSNLYAYSDGERTLVRPLVPAGAGWFFAADAAHLAYVRLNGIELTSPAFVVVASPVLTTTETVLFDSADDPDWAPSALVLSSGRVAYALSSLAGEEDWIRVNDLALGAEILARRVPVVCSVALSSTHLAYTGYVPGESTGGRVVLVDLRTDTDITLAEGLRADTLHVYLTANQVVWGEETYGSATRVVAYDIPTGVARVWTTDARGTLAGATDDFLVTEEAYVNDRGVGRFTVRRYDAAGAADELADFRADGLAGQSQIIGTDAVWVNDSRHVLVQPLAGGDRRSFRPF